MIPRIYHKGTLIAEAGALCWLAALGVSGLRSGRLAVGGLAVGGDPIPGYWIGIGLAAGLLLVMWGITWEMRVDLTPVSGRALTTLHWFARHCPHAADLLQTHPHPTWAEAFHVDDLCRKRARNTITPKGETDEHQ